MSNGGFLNKKVSWTTLKSKVTIDNHMDYQTHSDFFQVFVIVGSTKFYTNIFFPNEGKKIIGVSPTNNADYQDFIDNYKDGIDNDPPYLVQPVDLPKNLTTGDKLVFHESSRPDTKDKQFISCWAGAGDDTVNHVLWGGPLLGIENEVDVSSKSVEARFDPQFGDVWVHEGYAMWENGGWGDELDVYVIAPGAPLQQVANLDLVVSANRVKYSQSGPGTGTHGFADTPAPVVMHNDDGDWDLVGGSLQPNFAGTGEYCIFTDEKVANHFISRLPITGTNYSYTMLQSADSSVLPYPYFIRLQTTNNSNSAWKIWFFLTLYRERTRPDYT